MKNNDKWSALSMAERADLIKLYVSNGVTSLNDIKKDYNSFDDGGNKSKPLVYEMTPSSASAINATLNDGFFTPVTGREEQEGIDAWKPIEASEATSYLPDATSEEGQRLINKWAGKALIGTMTPEKIEALPRDYSKRVIDRIQAVEVARQVNKAQNNAGNFIFSKAIPIGLSIAGLGPMASLVNNVGWLGTGASVAGGGLGSYALGNGAYYLADLYDKKHGTNYAPFAGFLGNLVGGFGGGYLGNKVYNLGKTTYNTTPKQTPVYNNNNAVINHNIKTVAKNTTANKYEVSKETLAKARNHYKLSSDITDEEIISALSDRYDKISGNTFNKEDFVELSQELKNKIFNSKQIGTGSESTVYNGGDVIYKVTHPVPYNQIGQVRAWHQGKNVLGDAGLPLDLIGTSTTDDGVSLVFSQQKVKTPFKKWGDFSQPIIDYKLKKLGITKKDGYYITDKGVKFRDVNASNVGINEKGNIVIFDPYDVSPEVGGYGFGKSIFSDNFMEDVNWMDSSPYKKYGGKLLTKRK